jgi:hypothetical protein
MSLRLENIASERLDAESDVAAYKILSYPADFTLEGLFLKWEKSEIIIPPFQRKYVWTQSQASRLVESFLLGLPVPGIFLYKDRDSENLLVIDGQQRLRSIAAYFKGRFPATNKAFTLQKTREPWANKAFEDLSDKDKGQLKNSVLRATVIQQLDPRDDTSVFHIFERLNTGGTTLTQQEVRNCIYYGALNDLLIELNKGSNWRRIVGKKEPDIRMRDVELILRIFGVANNVKHYAKPMKDFLSSFMKEHKAPTAGQIASFKASFERATEHAVKSLGSKPFNLRQGVNVPTCEAVMAVLLNHDRNIANLKGRFSNLVANDDFKNYTADATTDTEVVKKRYRLAEQTLVG